MASAKKKWYACRPHGRVTVFRDPPAYAPFKAPSLACQNTIRFYVHATTRKTALRKARARFAAEVRAGTLGPYPRRGR